MITIGPCYTLKTPATRKFINKYPPPLAVAVAIIMPVAILVMLAFNLFNQLQEKLVAS